MLVVWAGDLVGLRRPFIYGPPGPARAGSSDGRRRRSSPGGATPRIAPCDPATRNRASRTMPVSRLRPFMIMCSRKIPSNVNPRRCAARFGTAHSARGASHSSRPVAQRLEDMARQQVHRLRGAPSRSLQRRRVDDAANLDHAVSGLECASSAAVPRAVARRGRRRWRSAADRPTPAFARSARSKTARSSSRCRRTGTATGSSLSAPHVPAKRARRRARMGRAARSLSVPSVHQRDPLGYPRRRGVHRRANRRNPALSRDAVRHLFSSLYNTGHAGGS